MVYGSNFLVHVVLEVEAIKLSISVRSTALSDICLESTRTSFTCFTCKLGLKSKAIRLSVDVRATTYEGVQVALRFPVGCC